MLACSPGFTIVAVVSLALGICIATCAMSEMNGIVLRNLPGATDPSQLRSKLQLRIQITAAMLSRGTCSPPRRHT